MPALLDSLARFGAMKAEEIALSIPGDDDLSWRELEQLSNRLANAMLMLGCKPGDRICLLGENSLSYAIAFVATLKTGGCAVPLPILISAEAIRLMIVEVEPAAIFVSRAQAKTWREIAAGLQWPLPRMVSLDGAAPAHGSMTIHELCSSGGDKRPDVSVADESLFNIIYSSGTTGTPKGIMHSHAFRAAQVHYVSALAGISSSSRLLVATPFYSNSTITPFTSAMMLGAQCILLRKFDTEDFILQCSRRRPTHAAMVPVQIERVLDHPAFERERPMQPIIKISGAAKLTVERKRQILGRWPGNLIECYGMTEGGPVTALDAERDGEHLDTVGKPLLDSDIRIIDNEDRELPRGAAGEIVGRSATMMTGYYRQPELSANQQWRDSQGRVYLRTGDIGRFDEEGYLCLLDRKKDIIISGGFNIYATDLEAVLRQHADVAEAAVVGVRSREWGETPVGFVVRRERALSSADEIRGWANERLGKIQRLAAVLIRDALPRGSLGKVLKRQLREEYEAAQPSVVG